MAPPPPCGWSPSPSAARTGRTSLERRLQRVEDGRLARQDLRPRLAEAVPGGFVHLGKFLERPAPRWIFEAEIVADDPRGIEIAFEGEGLDPFAAFLADPAERPGRALRLDAQ